MFVAITIFAFWLGVELKVVRERESMLKRIAMNGEFDREPRWMRSTHYRPNCVWTTLQTGTQRLPLFWSYCGAERISGIYVDRCEFVQSEIVQMQRLFPEADIEGWLDN